MNDFHLRPITVVVVASAVASCIVMLANEGAMTTIASLNEVDVGISGEFAARFWGDADERIVGGVQDQRGHADPIDDMRRRSSVIIVGNIAKTAVVGRDLVVELSQASEAAKTVGIEVLRKYTRFLLHAAVKSHQEVCFVNAVGWFVQSIRRFCQINRRANRRYGNKL